MRRIVSTIALTLGLVSAIAPTGWADGHHPGPGQPAPPAQSCVIASGYTNLLCLGDRSPCYRFRHLAHRATLCDRGILIHTH